MMFRSLLFTAPIIAAIALAATAQTADHSGHGAGHGHGQSAVDTPGTAAYMAANDVMHGAMAITFTGDADVDFILGMIPHHEGAVAMAEILLEYGDDPEVRALAEEIIAAQAAEIAWMKDWLARNGHATDQ
jgi:uncharacterized protein (DUF305 family)